MGNQGAGVMEGRREVSTPTGPRTTASKLNYDQSSQAIAKRGDTPKDLLLDHKEFLDRRMAQIARWTTQGVRPEALVRFALLDMDGEKGAKLRACSPQSIYLGLLACAVTGLEPGALKGEAYLVPYAGVAQFMPGYRGIIKQARRSREVMAMWANIVFERDTFDLDHGSANKLVHRPALRDRGDIIGAYAIARMANGHDEIEWMDRDDLEAVKNAGNKGPAWKDWEDQMFRKAPYRRLGKRLPLGADYYVALALENAPNLAAQAKLIDNETDGEASKALAAGAASAEMAAQAREPDAAELAQMAAEDARAAKS